MTQPPTHSDAGAIYDVGALSESHAAAVGSVAIIWNALHDALGSLFAEVVTPDSRTIALAAWQAVSSDRSKRNMLHAACVAALDDDSKFTQEVKWINGQLNSLEDKRNDAVHAPYTITFEDGALKIIPDIFSGNVRAHKLHGKDLAIELRSYHARISALVGFTYLLLGWSRLEADDPSWPERPALPRPAHAQARKS
jgi:hypothetical protein